MGIELGEGGYGQQTVVKMYVGTNAVSKGYLGTSLFYDASSSDSSSSGTSWTQSGQDIVGSDAGDHMGYSLMLSENGYRLVVSAYKEDVSTGSDNGVVYVYNINSENTTWSQVGNSITNSVGNAQDYSGFAVDCDRLAGRVVIGTPYRDSNSKINNGLVRVFDLNSSNTSWVQSGTDFAGANGGDLFGWSVSMSDTGSRMVIGAPTQDSEAMPSGNEAGRVVAYELSGSTWSVLGNVTDMRGEATDENFGWSCDMSADGAYIVAGGAETNGSGSGVARVYGYDSYNDEWTQVGSDIDGDDTNDSFGASVAINRDGTRIIIGGVYGGNNSSGYAKVYARSGSNFTQLGSTIYGSDNENFGRSVDINEDGDRIVISGMIADNSTGVARVYEWSGLQWSKMGADFDGARSNSLLGSNVAFDADGTTLAIGSSQYDGVNNDTANIGRARVFRWG